jgi:hypothetical protein
LVYRQDLDLRFPSVKFDFAGDTDDFPLERGKSAGCCSQGLVVAFGRTARENHKRRRRVSAAEKLVQTASMISTQPIALQLRFLQTMREISSEHHTTTILPVPLDLFAPFIKRSESQTPKES